MNKEDAKKRVDAKKALIEDVKKTVQRTTETLNKNIERKNSSMNPKSAVDKSMIDGWKKNIAEIRANGQKRIEGHNKDIENILKQVK